MTDFGSTDLTRTPQLPEVFLKRTFSLINSNSDRNSVSLVCKDWYNFERLTRRHVSIRNCYAVSPEIVAARFPAIRSVSLKGKPRFSDFNLVPEDWGADVQPWLSVFATAYPLLEELRLKRMTVSDESLEFLGMNFDAFKALSMLSCDGFSTIGLEAIATYSNNAQSRILSVYVTKMEHNLTELGTGTLSENLVSSSVNELESAFSKCGNLHTLSGFWDASLVYIPAVYPVCGGLTFLNLSYSELGADELEQILTHCKRLTRLWVLDTVGDKGLEAVGSHCPLLEELRVFPADPLDPQSGVSDEGIIHS
ncbi:transport inhibitor response 1-like protein [Tanacetum coccineum]